MALFPFLGKDYTSAGSGVAKNAPRKKPFFRFWDMYLERFWKMVKLSLLTSLFCLPVVTIGPAIAGMTKVLRSYVLDKDTFIMHDFFKGFTENWKKSVPMGLIDIVFILSLFASLNVYPAMADAQREAGGSGTFYTVLCVVSVGFALTVAMMNFYIYPMIVSTTLGFKDIIKNSFYLTCLELKTSIITLVIILLSTAVVIIMYFLSNPLIFLLFPCILLGLFGFLIMFNCYPLIQKRVIDPYYKERGQDNPEYDFLKPLDPEDAVFIDKGGEEAPIEGKKATHNKKKGTKVIK